MADESNEHAALRDSLEQALGTGPAMTLIQALPPRDMATRRDIEWLGQRVGRLERRFDGLEGRFDGLEGRFDGLEGRFDGLEGEVRHLGTRIDVLAERVDATGDRTEARVRAELEQRLAQLTQDLFVHFRILAVAMVVIVLGALSISLAT